MPVKLRFIERVVDRFQAITHGDKWAATRACREFVTLQ